MKISVVVVTMGGSSLLERCLGAIGTGVRRPHEVVVVDQGPPGLRSRLEGSLTESGVELRHVRITRAGLARARNTGVDMTTGDHLAFTDDDCVPHPSWLAALASAIERDAADAASGRVLPLDEGVPRLVAVSSRTDTRKLTFRRGGGHSPWDLGTGGNLLISRSRFFEIGGFDDEFGVGAHFRSAEDIEMLERLLRAGARVAYTPEAVVYHQMKTRSGRLRRRFPYGFGMGALVARSSNDRRRPLSRRYMAMQARAIASGLRHASPRRILEPMLSSVGFVAGFTAAARSRDGRTHEE